MKIEKIVMRNFLQFEDKTIEVPDEPVVLICGPNNAGKSTTLDAIRYAFTDRVGRGAQNADCRDGRLLRQGSDDGFVTVETAEGQTITRDLLYESRPEVSVGLEPKDMVSLLGCRVFTLSPDERCMALLRSSGEEPEPAELRGMLAEKLGIEDAGRNTHIALAIADFENGGFGHAEAEARARATETKRLWKQTTGEPWGRKKAKNWTPGDAVQDRDTQALRAKLKALRAELAQLWRERRQALSVRVDALTEKIESDSAHRMECPHCGGYVEEWAEFEGAPIALRASEDEKKIAQMVALAQMPECPLSELTVPQRALFFGSMSLDAIASWDEASAAERKLAAELEEAEKPHFETARVTGIAAGLNQQVEFWLKVADLLSPSGIPAALTGPAVAEVNAVAASLSEALRIDWLSDFGLAKALCLGRVDLMRSDFTLSGEETMGASQGWLADLAVTIALAKGAPILLVDGADVVQPDLRGKLLSFFAGLVRGGGFRQIIVAATLKQAPKPIPGVLGVVDMKRG